MSEKIYACLLHLYPARFRQTYSHETLPLFRDRSRHETEYGGPFFDVSGYEAPRLRSLLLAGILSLATFGSVTFLIGQGGRTGSPRAWTVSYEEPGPLGQAPGARRHQHLLDAVIDNIKQYYFDPATAQRITEDLLAHQKRGDYNGMIDEEQWAKALTAQIRSTSHDMHFEVIYSEQVLPDGPREPTPEMIARYRKELAEQHCAFEQVKVLPHNIGYLKLNAFPDLSFCKSTAVKAMASLNHANAIIFDLRDNHGGSAEMVSLIAGYLFDHPEFLFDPRKNPTPQSWTLPQPASRLTNKPAYILTSRATISAAEQFTYDLKMLKRVTVIGETTHGSAHAGVFHRLDDHFGLAIPGLKAINPFSTADWEETGIAPDVKTKPADALETAERLAARKLN